jgi:glutaredoxin
VDSVPSLKAWADSLGGIEYPLLSDFYPHGQVTQRYGVLRSEGYPERAIFIIDKLGIIRYVDVHDIDEQPDNEVLFKELEQIEPRAAPAPPPADPQPVEAPRPSADVVLYCTPWCPDCRRVRNLFRENHIDFAEIDITRDRAAAQRVRGWANGFETTPTIDVRGTIIVGYKKQELATALGIEEIW